MILSLKRRIFIGLIILTSSIVFTTPIIAQQGDIIAGRIAGEQAANASVNGTTWFLAGFLPGCLYGVTGLIGVLFAYVYEPNPSAMLLVGKSAEYVAAYTDAYRATAKKKQTNKAWEGCISAGLVWVVLILASSTG